MDLQKRLIADVEKRFGRQIRYQRDCQTLSAHVFEQIHEYISPATLRRLFGFLVTNSKPSRVTLDILSRYLGYQHWNAYVEAQRANSSNPTVINKVELRDLLIKKSEEINQHSIKAIRIKSGIPFEQTIRRPGVEALLSQFAKSTKAGLAIIAPGGYGKSTLIAHWCINQSKKNPNQLVFILPASRLELFAQSELTIDEWIWEQVGISNFTSPNLMEELRTLNLRTIFVFEALDEISLGGIKLEKILRGINELTVEFSKTSILKLIITSRGVTWKSLQNYISDSSPWMNIDNINFNSDGANIPPLSLDEIQSILDGTINKQHKERLLIFELPAQLRQTLSYPFFLQLFVKSYSPESISLLSNPLNIINEFFRKKLYETINADEKVDILNFISSYWWEKNYTPTKQEIKKQFPIHLKTAGAYHDAYMDLLSFGIIQEEKRFTTSLGYETYVSISNARFTIYLLAQNLIKKFGFTEQLILWLSENASQHEYYVMLLSTIYNLAFTEKEIALLVKLADLTTSLSEPDQLIQTMHICFRNDESMIKELAPHFLNSSSLSKRLILDNTDYNAITTSFRKIIAYTPIATQHSAYAHLINAYSLLISLEISKIKRSALSIPPSTEGKYPQHIAAMWHIIRCITEAEGELSSNIQSIINHYNAIETQKGRFDFREALLPIVLLDNAFNPLLRIYDEPLDVSVHQKALDSIVRKYLAIRSKREPLKPGDHNLLLQNYTQLNPLKSNMGFVVGEVARALSYFFANELEPAHRCIRNAIELCGVSHYRLPEMVLMKMFGLTLIRFGENEHGTNFVNYANTLRENSGISSVTRLFLNGTL